MSRPPSLKKLRILITAGPTRERIDPVRFISNYSTGTFGYEIARQARRLGHAVTLISGPTGLKAPSGVKFARVESAAEMRRAVLRHFRSSDCLIMAAAVSDWRPAAVAAGKIKKGAAVKSLRLMTSPDILKELGRKKGPRVLVGFALETEGLESNALKKLEDKNLDIIVANKLTSKKTVFGNKKTDIVIIDRLGNTTRLYGKSKGESAKIILDKVLSLNI